MCLKNERLFGWTILKSMRFLSFLFYESVFTVQRKECETSSHLRRQEKQNVFKKQLQTLWQLFNLILTKSPVKNHHQSIFHHHIVTHCPLTIKVTQKLSMLWCNRRVTICSVIEYCYTYTKVCREIGVSVHKHLSVQNPHQPHNGPATLINHKTVQISWQISTIWNALIVDNYRDESWVLTLSCKISTLHKIRF